MPPATGTVEKPDEGKETIPKLVLTEAAKAVKFPQFPDFTWREDDEPHATRRRVIASEFPEVLELCTKEPRTFTIAVVLVLVQLIFAVMAQKYFPFWLTFIAAYVVGGTINHSLQLAVHELSHNLCFSSGIANKALAIFCNLPTGMPSANTFQKYHMEHHQFQGCDGLDTDVPTMWEVRTFTNSLLKTCWLILQPVFYALRPLVVRPKAPDTGDLVNGVICFGFDILLYKFVGGYALAYLLMGTFLGLGLHPAAGHFIAEHYQMRPGQETYSYYGPLNMVNFNVGYHMEHHDFPRIPWSNLPKLRQIAKKYYEPPYVHYHQSYLAIMWRYITDPSIGPFSRIKRQLKPNSSMIKQADDNTDHHKYN